MSHPIKKMKTRIKKKSNAGDWCMTYNHEYKEFRVETDSLEFGKFGERR